jgi:hypothetical protein
VDCLRRGAFTTTNGIGIIGQMKIPPVSGFDIHIDGVWRTFRDQQATAFEAAKLLKQKNRFAVVTIINTATGKAIVMLEDGRTG